MITSLKELEKLIKLCRKQGVTKIETMGVSLELGDMPSDGTSIGSIDHSEDSAADPYSNFPKGILTPEQLTFYSAGGSPEDDPTANPVKTHSVSEILQGVAS